MINKLFSIFLLVMLIMIVSVSLYFAFNGDYKHSMDSSIIAYFLILLVQNREIANKIKDLKKGGI